MNGTMTQPTSTKMSRKEARVLMARIKHSFRDCRLWILQLYERQGWRALGYSSWRECVAVEFGQSARHLYRLLVAAQVDRELEDAGEELPAGGIPERQARALKELDTANERLQVYAEAHADGEVSAAKIERIIAGRKGHSADQISRNSDIGAKENDPNANAGSGTPAAIAPAFWRVMAFGGFESLGGTQPKGARVIVVRPGDVVRLATE